jgi:hypothetical protein
MMHTKPQAARKRPALKALRWLAITALAITALLLLASAAMHNATAFLAVSSALHSIRPYLIATHLSLIALLCWRWSQAIHFASKRRWIAQSQIQQALSLRTRVTALLLICETALVIRPWAWL